MKLIYKYPIPLQDQFVIPMPFGSKILSVQIQKGQPCIWAIVDTDKEICARSFLMFGTGHPLPHDIMALPFIGTFQTLGGDLVFHLFEGIS